MNDPPDPVTTTTTMTTDDSVPPPGYAPCRPQIMVAPLSDAATFFGPQCVQGEVFVKGLGQGGPSKGVRKLTVELRLTNTFPGCEPIALHEFEPQVLWPVIQNTLEPQASSAAAATPPQHLPEARQQSPFPTVHRFDFKLPSDSSISGGTSATAAAQTSSTSRAGPSRPTVRSPPTALPGTLNLSAYDRGEIKWSLRVRLQLDSSSSAIAAGAGDVIEEVLVEGTPYEAEPVSEFQAEQPHEVEEYLDRKGVRARMVVEDGSPRLGSLLRLGVEVRPKEREKTGVKGLAAQPDPAATLRPLRRVRVELFRRVKLLVAPDVLPAQGPSSSSSSASATDQTATQLKQHLTLLHASGKSLRYPGRNTQHPPLRLLFTLPTVQLGSSADQSYGEITMATPYHDVSFFVRVTVGFSGTDVGSHMRRDTSAEDTAGGNWVIEREIVIRPRIWEPPKLLTSTAAGTEPSAALDMEDALSLGGMSEEEMVREEYRRKGLDIVGAMGTFRADQSSTDRPPSFEEAGPSTYDFHATTYEDGDTLRRRQEDNTQVAGHPPVDGAGGELPTFMESEAEIARGQPGGVHDPAAPTSPSYTAVHDAATEPPFDRNTWVGRRGSLRGELGTWLEYDGYETFSVAPPSMSASFGASGSMDPPQPEDEELNVVEGMAVRLGLGPGTVGGVGRAELMEQLGLGEGTRVIDLQDDLPPGIDEPSLPALPDFSGQTYRPRAASHPRGTSGLMPVPGAITPDDTLLHHHDDVSPPSFAASEAAQAIGGVAMGGMRRSASGVAGVGVAGLPMPLGSIASPLASGGHHPPVLTDEALPPPQTSTSPPSLAPPPLMPEGEEARGAPPGYEGHAGPPPGGPPAYS